MQELSFKHLNFLTDDFGIWQHTIGDKIDRQYGYALDDVARGLLVAVSYDDQKKIKIYISFLTKAIKIDHLTIFFDENRQPLPIKCSEDALGEAYWALAECLKAGFFPEETEKLLKICEHHIKNFVSIRGKSYAILGAVNYNPKLAHLFANAIIEQTICNSSKNWFWPEDILTYANAIIPLGVLTAAEKFNDSKMKNVGLELLQFLNSQTKVGKIPIAIGHLGWYKKNETKAIFSQQPIDPAYQVLANVKAWKVAGENYFLSEALNYFSWFWGNNLLEEPLINLKRQSCYDSLAENSIRKNQGAENIVCYLFMQKILWSHLIAK